MEYYANHTTPYVSPSTPSQDFHGYYALIPFVLVSLAGCALVMVIYFKRKSRSHELRHRLIPMYTYDPAEQEEGDFDYGSREDEEGLKEPLYKYGQLSINNDYGME